LNNFKIESLILDFKREKEVIPFSPGVTFFHGPISAGKSSIARLVNYCLGGDLEKTIALSQELVTARLQTQIGTNKVVFERNEQQSDSILVLWTGEDGKTQKVLAPIRSSPDPIWKDNVFNISDLIFDFCGMQSIKVPFKEKDPQSLVKLSFQDIMRYCYLEQNQLDSSFYYLESPILAQKSRYAQRFFVGAFSEKLSQLKVDLTNTKNLHQKKDEEAKQINLFLEKFGYNSASNIELEIEEIKKSLLSDTASLRDMQEGYQKDTHFADDLRSKLRILRENITGQEQAVMDLKIQIREQEALKAELLSTKSKLARSETAQKILADIPFKTCPECGSEVLTISDSRDICRLCKQPPETTTQPLAFDKKVAEQDLISRISELEESIGMHSKALMPLTRELENAKKEKAILDNKLDEQVKVYDSRFLTNSLDIENRIATSKERLRNLEATLQMPKALATLEQETYLFHAKEEELRHDANIEEEKLKSSEKYIEEIERNFLSTMIACKVPDVNEDDKITINRHSWIPDVFVRGKDTVKWSFHTAGSAGKKTLFNVCYALALHTVASRHNLNLPNFLMIDAPMKNIGEDKKLNRDIFESFYTYLYGLSLGVLSNTQFIIFDKEYFEPSDPELKIIQRYMTRDDPANPPLIPYYHE
jgi:hypothetical protein